MIFYRMHTKYMVSDGVENLRKKMKRQTLGPLDKRKLIKWTHCGTRETPECYRITLTKKGMRELRKR